MLDHFSLNSIESLFLRISSKRGSNTYCVSTALRTFRRLHALTTRGTNGPTEVNTKASVGRAPRKACSMNTRRPAVPTLTLTGLTYETTIPNYLRFEVFTLSLCGLQNYSDRFSAGAILTVSHELTSILYQ